MGFPSQFLLVPIFNLHKRSINDLRATYVCHRRCCHLRCCNSRCGGRRPTTASLRRILPKISDPFVVKSSCMGGIPPARFANHAPFSIMFSNATICGKHCRHLNIIALPLSASVGSITSIATALTSRAASTAASTSATTTASILGEFGLGLINPI